MFQIGKTIVSEEIIKKRFVCDLSACKGCCCVEGDAGAPLTAEEAEVLDEIYVLVKPLLRKQAVEAIETQGTWVKGADGELETPLIDHKDCAYVIYDQGTSLCAIEQAYNQGIVEWKKPISCHLYPIRLNHFSEFVAVNYDVWSICSDACALGKELEVPVYRFVKEALVRRFGEDWFAELDKTAMEMERDTKRKKHS